MLIKFLFVLVVCSLSAGVGFKMGVYFSDILISFKMTLPLLFNLFFKSSQITSNSSPNF